MAPFTKMRISIQMRRVKTIFVGWLHILWTPSVMVHQLYSTKEDGLRKIKIYLATARKYYDVSCCLEVHCVIMTRGWRPMEPGVVDDCLQCLSTIMTHHTNSSKQHHHHLCSFVKYV